MLPAGAKYHFDSYVMIIILRFRSDAVGWYFFIFVRFIFFLHSGCSPPAPGPRLGKGLSLRIEIRETETQAARFTISLLFAFYDAAAASAAVYGRSFLRRYRIFTARLARKTEKYSARQYHITYKCTISEAITYYDLY